MPRNVRNFWLTLDVDGRKTPIATGPVAKDGGFTLRIQIRRNGEVCEAGYVRGIAKPDGTLTVLWDGTEPCPAYDVVLSHGRR